MYDFRDDGIGADGPTTTAPCGRAGGAWRDDCVACQLLSAVYVFGTIGEKMRDEGRMAEFVEVVTAFAVTVLSRDAVVTDRFVAQIEALSHGAAGA